jgi:hypothetical protein
LRQARTTISETKELKTTKPSFDGMDVGAEEQEDKDDEEEDEDSDEEDDEYAVNRPGTIFFRNEADWVGTTTLAGRQPESDDDDGNDGEPKSKSKSRRSKMIGETPEVPALPSSWDSKPCWFSPMNRVVETGPAAGAGKTRIGILPLPPETPPAKDSSSSMAARTLPLVPFAIRRFIFCWCVCLFRRAPSLDVPVESYRSAKKSAPDVQIGPRPSSLEEDFGREKILLEEMEPSGGVSV